MTRHLPRPQDSPELRVSGGVRTTDVAVRPCEIRQRSALQVCDALVVEHLPFAAKVAANFARRTGHPREDLEQLAAIGLIKASRRYDDKRINNSKSSRAHAAAPLMEAGQLAFNPGNDELINELLGFPNAANDDLVDAFCQGVIWLQNKYWRANSRGTPLPLLFSR